MGRPLGAIDRFHLRLHRETRAAGLGGASCVLVASLEGRVPRERLARRLREASAVRPELGWRLGWQPGRGSVWRPGRAPELGERSFTADLEPLVEERLAAPIDGARPLEVELWHGPTSDTLALRWFHPLTDALGAARLLLWLGEEAPSAGDRPSFAAPDERLPAGFRERLELARRYGQHALSLAQGGPILSPARWVKDAPPGRPRVHRIRFTEEETRRFDLARRRRAGLAEASIIVLAAARLCHRLLREGGGDAPAQHLAVMPVSLDPKGQRDRLFGNNITTLLLALPSASLDDEAAVLARLAAQRRAIVRDGLELGMVASLAAFRALPDGFVHWLAGSPFAGQRGSFIASSPGPLPLERLFGQRVVDAYTSVVPSPQPGLVIVTERQGGRLSLQLCHLDGQIPAASLAAQSGALRADLLGEMR